jgi:hypothetical protein
MVYQVLNSNDPVGAIIEIYRQKDNVSLSRLAVIQVSQNTNILKELCHKIFDFKNS